MYRIIITIALSLIAIFTAVLVFRSSITPQSTKQLDIMTREAERISGDKFSFSRKSPKGVRVYSTVKPTKEIMNAIDSGFDDLFAIARRKPNNYRKHLKHSFYTVYIANPDRLMDSKKNYSPDIAVSANQYAGSKYDKGGYIYAAGMIVSASPSSFLIANHTKDFKRVSNVVRFEGEHLVLFHNDRRRFNSTADHSKGGGHPILN